MQHHPEPEPHRYPGDIARAPEPELLGPGMSQRRDTWQIVIIAIEGEWRPALLTEWRLLPSGWAALVRWRQDPGDPVGGWAWVAHDPERLQPLSPAGIDAAGLA